jgi:hypothetical protein
VNHLARWDTKYVVQAAASLARLGYTQHTALLQLLLAQFVARLPKQLTTPAARSSSKSQGSSQQQQVLLWPFANQAALLLWCCAVLDVQEPADALKPLLKVLRQADVAGCQLPQQSLAQLVQVQMWLQVSLIFTSKLCSSLNMGVLTVLQYS